MAKSTISMAIFNSKLLVYQRVHNIRSFPKKAMGIPSHAARCSSGPSTKAWTKVLKFSSGHRPMPGRGSCLKEFSSMPCARWRDGNSWKTMEKLMKNNGKPWKNHETTIIFSSRIWEWWGFTGKISGLKRAIKYEDLRFAIGICQAKQIEHLKNVGIYLHYLNDVCFSSATYGCQEYVTCWCAT